MSENLGCISRKKGAFPQGNAVYTLRALKSVRGVLHWHPNSSGIAAFGTFPIHPDCGFSMAIYIFLLFNSTTDLLLTKDFMPVIMQCNTATSRARATVRGDPLPKAQTHNI